MADDFEEYTVRCFVLYHQWPERKRRLMEAVRRLAWFGLYACAVWTQINLILDLIEAHYHFGDHQFSLIAGIWIGCCVWVALHFASRAFESLVEADAESIT